MLVKIQIRNMPAALQSQLKSRAALEGISLSDCVLREARRAAERPTLEEIRERLKRRTPVRLPVSPAAALRAEGEGH
jgi:plasmid stability protein